ncbi:uncharacterized protein [Spinacia oleracea]|uniref:Reverse transcriptase domain-containing protein n=1 Tax=Spinacia oleracea TaxID=3562 RepID=A0ABM3RP45_SPIOL|nr:uncharacterized protein LOC130471358 [Spinacia oleracea]
MIFQACEEKSWKPFEMGRKRITVSHLLFADDLLLFGRADDSTTSTLREVLDSFCSVLGQKVNEEKSRLIFSHNTPNQHKTWFQELINVKESSSLGLYLGLPLSHKKPTRNSIQFVVEKRKKLANWKTTCLSRAGRLCLIRSTLNTIPHYYMQANYLPKATLNDLDKIINDFLWGHSENKRKLHLVAKEDMFKPKDQGGLGIRSHEKLNASAMAKLGWKLSQGEENLAYRCIHAKYVHANHVTKFSNGSPIWKSVGKDWDLLASNSVWEVGNGENIHVWTENWRNKFVFEGKAHDPPNIVLNRATTLALEFLKDQHQSVAPSPAIYSQSDDLRNIVHVNVDASFVKHDTPSSIAGVVRDSTGNWLLGFTKLIYAVSPLHAELLIIQEAL